MTENNKHKLKKQFYRTELQVHVMHMTEFALVSIGIVILL